jgi:hypothetical protein
MSGGSSFASRRWLALGLAALVAIAVAALVSASRGAQTRVALRAKRHAQTTWAACNRNARNRRPSTFRPLSDARAAALVTREAETRPYNARAYMLDGKRYAAPNYFVPSPAAIRKFRRARTDAGQSVLAFNPYLRYVDGRDGMKHPSTDMLIQWAAHKWGIPEDWLRAEYVHETYWNQYFLGDATSVNARSYDRYPSQSRIPGTHQAYQSLGIAQVRWDPEGSLNAGSEPLRWESTAFNVDLQASTLRFYYDNPQGSRSAWNDPTYQPCQAWNSIGGWFRPYPWNNSDQASYVHAVQQLLAGRVWTTSSFVHWSNPPLPRRIRFLR